MAIDANEYMELEEDIVDMYYPLQIERGYLRAVEGRELSGEWKIEEASTLIDHWEEAQAHLAELIRDEIDRMILEELYREVEEQKAIVDEILSEKLFEV